MNFQKLKKVLKFKIALDLCEKAAEQGRDSFFDKWWYFDTNCLSELVKLSKKGYSIKINDFIQGRDILLSSTHMQELRNAPNILRSIPLVLSSANVYLVPDLTKFWYTDILNFLNVNHKPINSLQVYPLQPQLLDMITYNRKKEFEQVCAETEFNIAQQFHTKVEPDIGADLDERKLCAHIVRQIKHYSNGWFQIDIKHEDCHATNFPSFYVFFYTYYFRYIKNRNIKPNKNDFIDMLNCLAAPYCERFYFEAAFTSILRNNVKGRKPPTAFQIIKKLYKKGLIDKKEYEIHHKNKRKLSHTSPLLEHNEIFNFSEMRSQIIRYSLS